MGRDRFELFVGLAESRRSAAKGDAAGLGQSHPGLNEDKTARGPFFTNAGDDKPTIDMTWAGFSEWTEQHAVRSLPLLRLSYPIDTRPSPMYTPC